MQEPNDFSNDCKNETFGEIIQRRVARRDFLKSAAATGAMLVVNPITGQTQSGPAPLTFAPISLSTEDRVIVPPGYQARPLISWGDALFPGVPAFNVKEQTAAMQALRFGYNCDFLYFLDMPARPFEGIARSQEGVLWVNHEYTNPELMFPNYDVANVTKEQVDIQLAAHGGSVVTLERATFRRNFARRTEWAVNQRSFFNRRITAETPMMITGPAAGSELLRTTDDATGTRVRGMLNNCGGGVTPWNTIITAEENFNQYFAKVGDLPATDRRRAMHTRYGLPSGASEYRWENFYNRFDVSKEPNEAFRFGYVVEVDPFNPNWTPRKRTALGRLKHEACTFVVAPDSRVVAYTGDDERFEYMYKFVTQGKFDPSKGLENSALLDEGTLYVAKYNDNGTGEWLPLVAGQGALAAWSQAEICINTRAAADAVGATKMDRPEDIETNPVNKKVYCVFTNNTRRGATGQPGPDKANPRATNTHGHIIELTEANNDATAKTFTWGIFMLCGDPSVAAQGTYFAGFQGTVSPISSPDNITFDRAGNLWIATDGQINTFRRNDGIYVVPTEGSQRGNLRQLLSGVPGGEIASLAMSADDRFLFASIQHPGEGSTLASPTSTFPHGDIPRPTVVVVENDNGTRVIGA